MNPTTSTGIRTDILGGIPLPNCPLPDSSIPSPPSIPFVLHSPTTSFFLLGLAVLAACFALYTALRLNSVTLFSRLIHNKTLRNGYWAMFFLCLSSAAFIDVARYVTGVAGASTLNNDVDVPIMDPEVGRFVGWSSSVGNQTGIGLSAGYEDWKERKEPSPAPPTPVPSPPTPPPTPISMASIDGVLLLASSFLRAAAALQLALALNHQLKWRTTAPPDPSEEVVSQPEASPRFLTYISADPSPSGTPSASRTATPNARRNNGGGGTRETDALLPPQSQPPRANGAAPNYGSLVRPIWDDDDLSDAFSNSSEEEDSSTSITRCCISLRTESNRLCGFLFADLFSRKGVFALLLCADILAGLANAASRVDHPSPSSPLSINFTPQTFFTLHIISRTILQLPILFLTLSILTTPRSLITNQSDPTQPPRRIRYGPNKRSKLILLAGILCFLLSSALEPSWLSLLDSTLFSNPCPIPPHLWSLHSTKRGWASLADMRNLMMGVGVCCLFGFTVNEHRRSKKWLRFVTESWIARTFDFRRY